MFPARPFSLASRGRRSASLAVLLLITLITPVASADPASSDAYHVQWGDTLASIAGQYHTTVNALVELNGLPNADTVYAGQVLFVPGSGLLAPAAPPGQLVPDSEIVYGPSFVNFDLAREIRVRGGYLNAYTEDVEDQDRSGPDLVQLVTQRFSTGPRLLLALLEYRSGWLTNPHPADSTLVYPMGQVAPGYEKLYVQLMWAANHLNEGYYGYKQRGLSYVTLTDNTRVNFSPGLNAGTVALEYVVGLTSDSSTFRQQVDGVMQVYRTLWGDPFQHAVRIIPPGLQQPALKLPFAAGQNWYFTGGPHGAWGSGSAWGALDFAPGLESCRVDPAYWDVAAAPGTILRADNGEVIEDLDGDGHEQTGWVLLYMHVSDEDRIPVGSHVDTGTRLGHPSCQGGISTGSHVHFARRYNGQWISAAGSIPMVLSGWRPQLWSMYNGTLTRGSAVRTSYGGKSGINVMQSDNVAQ